MSRAGLHRYSSAPLKDNIPLKELIDDLCRYPCSFMYVILFVFVLIEFYTAKISITVLKLNPSSGLC